MDDAWQVFFAAQVGASAALLGLLFVGASLNLDKILAGPLLPRRGCWRCCCCSRCSSWAR